MAHRIDKIGSSYSIIIIVIHFHLNKFDRWFAINVNKHLDANWLKSIWLFWAVSPVGAYTGDQTAKVEGQDLKVQRVDRFTLIGCSMPSLSWWIWYHHCHDEWCKRTQQQSPGHLVGSHWQRLYDCRQQDGGDRRVQFEIMMILSTSSWWIYLSLLCCRFYDALFLLISWWKAWVRRRH